MKGAEMFDRYIDWCFVDRSPYAGMAIAMLTFTIVGLPLLVLTTLQEMREKQREWKDDRR